MSGLNNDMGKSVDFIHIICDSNKMLSSRGKTQHEWKTQNNKWRHRKLLLLFWHFEKKMWDMASLYFALGVPHLGSPSLFPPYKTTDITPIQ